MALVFVADKLPDPQSEYVAWLDVMGVQSSMARSLKITANFVFKLHAAAVQSKREGVSLYPVMDGLYAASAQKTPMLRFLRDTFIAVAQLFVDTDANLHRFIIRGALAFGPIVHGRDVPNSASPSFGADPAYKNAILLGLPIVQAHLGERDAPPFGLYVHESARSFAPPGEEPLHHVWWQWGNQQNDLWNTLPKRLDNHFKECMKRSRRVLYDPERISVHQSMAQQYFLPDSDAISGSDHEGSPLS